MINGITQLIISHLVNVITLCPFRQVSQKKFKNSVLIHLMSVMANMEYIMLNINIG